MLLRDASRSYLDASRSYLDVSRSYRDLVIVLRMNISLLHAQKERNAFRL